MHTLWACARSVVFGATADRSCTPGNDGEHIIFNLTTSWNTCISSWGLQSLSRRQHRCADSLERETAILQALLVPLIPSSMPNFPRIVCDSFNSTRLKTFRASFSAKRESHLVRAMGMLIFGQKRLWGGMGSCDWEAGHKKGLNDWTAQLLESTRVMLSRPQFDPVCLHFCWRLQYPCEYVWTFKPAKSPSPLQASPRFPTWSVATARLRAARKWGHGASQHFS